MLGEIALGYRVDILEMCQDLAALFVILRGLGNTAEKLGDRLFEHTSLIPHKRVYLKIGIIGKGQDINVLVCGDALPEQEGKFGRSGAESVIADDTSPEANLSR